MDYVSVSRILTVYECLLWNKSLLFMNSYFRTRTSTLDVAFSSFQNVLVPIRIWLQITLATAGDQSESKQGIFSMFCGKLSQRFFIRFQLSGCGVKFE